MRSDSDKITVQLLGSFSAQLRQQVVTPTAGKQRQILALLALRSGQVVTTSTLAEELWGGSRPRSFAVTLQTYIFQLRRLLATAFPEKRDIKHFLSTRYSGYMLECQTDVDEFQRLGQAGREAAEAGNPRAASEVLSRALTLWRGPALVDVGQGPVLEVEAAGLAQTRLGIIEIRIKCDLAMNRHNAVISELMSLAAEHPLNENFCGLLMRAYYHSGHTVQALEAFRRLRAALNLELGLEPSYRLQRVHQSILSGELTTNVSDLSLRSPETDLDRKGFDTNKNVNLRPTHTACPKFDDLASVRLRRAMAGFSLKE
jgi:SARP family transcriptional regulator, regulator of embCAB operon